MFCGVSNLDVSLFLNFLEKPFLIGFSHILPESFWLVLIMVLVKASIRGLSPSLKINVHDSLVISGYFLLLYIRTFLSSFGFITSIKSPF